MISINQEVLDLIALATIKNVGEMKVYFPKKGTKEMTEIVLNVGPNAHVQRTNDSITQVVGTKAVSLAKEAYQRFQIFASNIYKNKQLNDVVSRPFLEGLALRWIADIKIAGKTQGWFTAHLESEVGKAIKSYIVHFPILYLHIEKPFKIAGIELGRFTEEYFDAFIEACKRNNTNYDTYEGVKEEYEGKAYVRCLVKAEKEKAQALAFIKCAAALDVLKICSRTLDQPDFPLSFDIDKRIKHADANRIIFEVVGTGEKDNWLEGSFNSAGVIPQEIHQLNSFAKNGLEVFDQFLSSLPENQTELQKIILRGVQQLGSAFSNKHYAQRIAELFTILESLLLRGIALN